MTKGQYRKIRKKLFTEMSVMARRLGMGYNTVRAKEMGKRSIARRDVRLLELYVYMLDTAEKEGKTIDDAMRKARAILRGILGEPDGES